MKTRSFVFKMINFVVRCPLRARAMDVPWNPHQFATACANFIIFDTEFLVFNSQFLVFNKTFIISVV